MFLFQIKQQTLSYFVEKEEPSEDKVVIFVDQRERTSGIIRELIKKDLIIKAKQLQVADFLLSDRLAVERKSVESDTPVIIKINQDIKIYSIAECFTKFKEGANLEVMGINFKKDEISWFEAQDMLKHKSKNMYCISTSSLIKRKNTNEYNYNIKLTGGHSTYIFRNKKILCLPTNEIRRGDYLIIVPPKLPELNPIVFNSFDEFLKKVQKDSIKGYKIKGNYFKLNSGRTYYKTPKFNEDFLLY